VISYVADFSQPLNDLLMGDVFTQIREKVKTIHNEYREVAIWHQLAFVEMSVRVNVVFVFEKARWRWQCTYQHPRALTQHTNARIC
jgi:ABC-type long-subunit fatty acid transport system fused permease/ATPase subunit